MRIDRLLSTIPALLVMALSAHSAELALPDVIADHMVVQRDRPVPIWGRAAAGELVRVEFADQQKTARADDRGRWTAMLDPMPASSTPRSLTIQGEDHTIRIHDVLVGEVWLCSGQSNMVWTVKGSQRAEEFIAGAGEPRIRMFIVPRVADHEPRQECPGTWLVAGPETVGDFSAVGYHFGRNLIGHLDVPVGLLNSSWGGSTVEAWVSRPVLDAIVEARAFVEAYDQGYAASQMDVNGFVGGDIDERQWETVELPALIEAMGHDIDGIMWFRRPVEVPPSWAHHPLTLSLGAIDDRDVTYFNGTRIGATNSWQKERVYTVPAELVEAGTAIVAVRVEDTGGAGGFSGAPDDMSVHPEDIAAEARTLAGTWRLRVISDRPSGPVQHRPANLFNAMIHPLRHYAIRGVIWYQGESNAIRPRGEEYAAIFPALIRDWRSTFGDPDLPFYYVQLPNFTNNEPDTRWRYPVVRQAQLETMRSVPHTGMAVTLELGEADDIHPRNKHDVGERLARWALVDVYGVTGLTKSGPIFDSAAFLDGGEVHLSFDLYGSTLGVRDGSDTLAGFELASADHAFHPARATIHGDRVVVASDAVADPHRVRYAWRNNASEANLVNEEGWPASPFVAERNR